MENNRCYNNNIIEYVMHYYIIMSVFYSVTFLTEIKHMEEICRYLNLLSQDNIFDLGLALGISYTSLCDYQESVSSVKQFLRKVIAAWLRKQDYVEERGRIPTWENLVKALSDEQVRQNGIASTISKEKAIQQ